MFSKINFREIVYVLASLVSLGITYGSIQSELKQIKEAQQLSLMNQERTIREISELWKELIRVKTMQEVSDAKQSKR